jgi:hypothetical protein
MHYHKALIIIALSISLMACYDRKEGCFDPLADNFDVTVDDECDDCCTFPGIELRPIAINGLDSTYEVSDIIINDLAERFKIIDCRFYISAAKIYEKGIFITSPKMIQDSISKKNFIDDINILRAQDRSVKLGQYKYSGQPDSVSFVLGLSEEVLKGVYTSVPSSHPLSRSSRITDDIEKPLWMSITIASVAPQPDTIFVGISATPTVLNISSKQIKANKPGSSLTFPVYLDYTALLKSIRIQDDKQVIESKLRSNLSRYFRVI